MGASELIDLIHIGDTTDTLGLASAVKFLQEIFVVGEPTILPSSVIEDF